MFMTGGLICDDQGKFYLFSPHLVVKQQHIRVLAYTKTHTYIQYVPPPPHGLQKPPARSTEANAHSSASCPRQPGAGSGRWDTMRAAS